MSREVLAIDVDEVLVPFLDHFLIHHNETHGTNVQKDQFDSYDFDGPLGLSIPETVERVYAFLRTDHSHIEPIEGVEEGIGRLSTRYDLEVITARHSQFEVATWNWLQEKLPNRFRAIKSIGYAPIMETPITKVQVCKEVGAIALVDDSLKHVTQCAEEGVEGILHGDYTWNAADSLPPGVTRCKDMPAVADHFNV